VPKQAMENIAAKKRARQKDVDSDYLFDGFLKSSAFRSTDKRI
jgi:hypothetical protein